MVVTAWLVVNVGLPPTEALPRVELVSAARMSEVRRDQRDVHASYDDVDGVIYLSEGWSAASPAHVSILVHETVHHLQNVAGLTYACPQERERVAYEAQALWLEMLERNLADEFDIDPMTRLVLTTCMH